MYGGIGGSTMAAKKRKSAGAGVELDDELDTFQKTREKVLLNSGDEDSDESEEEAVFDLPVRLTLFHLCEGSQNVSYFSNT